MKTGYRGRLALGIAGAAAVCVVCVAACSGDPRGNGNQQAAKSSGTSANAASRSAAPAAAATVAAQPAAAAAATSAAASGQAPSGQSLPDPTAGGAASLDRKIIRNADVGLVVKDTGNAAQSIGSIATGLGGYVADSKLSRSDDTLSGTITVRVPADRFDDAMAQLRSLGVRVDHESVTSQDVTQEYADLDARVANLQATQDQFRALLDTVRQKSNNAQDILAVYRQLSDITGQIEQAKGRQQYLDKLSTLATIAVQLIPEVAPTPQPQPKPAHAWSPLRTLEDAGSVLADAGRLGVETLIWVAVVAVPIGALAALIAIAVLTVRRTLQRRRVAPSP